VNQAEAHVLIIEPMMGSSVQAYLTIYPIIYETNLKPYFFYNQTNQFT